MITLQIYQQEKCSLQIQIFHFLQQQINRQKQKIYECEQFNSNNYSTNSQTDIRSQLHKSDPSKDFGPERIYQGIQVVKEDEEKYNKYKPICLTNIPQFNLNQLLSMDKVLIFVRHAERVPLTYGDQLTPRGIEKAQEFGRWLKNKYPQLIYANPIFRSTHKKRTSRTNYIIQQQLYRDNFDEEASSTSFHTSTNKYYPIFSKDYSKCKEIKDFIVKQVRIILTDKQIEQLIELGNLRGIKDIPDYLDEIDTQVKQKKYTGLSKEIENLCQIKFDQLMNVVYSNRKVCLLLISKFYKDILSFMHNERSRFMLFSCHDTTLNAILKLIFKKDTYRIGQCDYLDYIIITQHGDELSSECLVAGNTHQELYFDKVEDLEKMFIKYIQYEGSQESFILDVEE